MQTLNQEQTLPISLDEAWNFFSNPANLEKITPPWLKFQILSPATDQIHAGQLLTYRVRIAPLVKVSWITEIKEVEPMKMFTDEQRVGPYAFWHHKHTFQAVENGVLMTDAVHYHTGFGPFGWVIERIYVDRSVEQIFEFRRSWLAEHFGS